MSGYYKAEEMYNAAVAKGYEGKFDGTLAGAIRAYQSVDSEGEVPFTTVDSEAMKNAFGTPENAGENTETPDENSETPVEDGE